MEAVPPHRKQNLFCHISVSPSTFHEQTTILTPLLDQSFSNGAKYMCLLQTEVGPLIRPDRPVSSPSPVYCYNCGKQGHYGHVSI